MSETAVAPVDPTPLPAAATGLRAEDVEAIVARQLDAKIGPLARMMVDMQDKGPSVADIFGGIGYILGLVGLGAYVRYRRDTRTS